MDIEPSNNRVCRVASQLKDPEVKFFCHFVAYAMKPLNNFNFSVAFQMHASSIGTLQPDVCTLLQIYLRNLIDPNVLRSTNDITSIDYRDQSRVA